MSAKNYFSAKETARRDLETFLALFYSATQAQKAKVIFDCPSAEAVLIAALDCGILHHALIDKFKRELKEQMFFVFQNQLEGVYVDLESLGLEALGDD